VLIPEYEKVEGRRSGDPGRSAYLYDAPSGGAAFDFHQTRTLPSDHAGPRRGPWRIARGTPRWQSQPMANPEPQAIRGLRPWSRVLSVELRYDALLVVVVPGFSSTPVPDAI